MPLSSLEFMLYYGYKQRQKSVILCKDTALFAHTQVLGQKSVKIHRFVSKVKKNSKGIARV